METYMIKVNGVTYEVEVEKKEKTAAGDAAASMAVSDGHRQSQPSARESAAREGAEPYAAAAAQENPEGLAVTAGTSGKVWKVTAKGGDVLRRGDTILILEAMKMEIPVVAPEDGRLLSVCVSEGDSIEAGQTVASIAR